MQTFRPSNIVLPSCGILWSFGACTSFGTSTQVLVLSSEGNFDPQRLALDSGTLLLGPMEEAQHGPIETVH